MQEMLLSVAIVLAQLLLSTDSKINIAQGDSSAGGPVALGEDTGFFARIAIGSLICSAFGMCLLHCLEGMQTGF